VLTLVLRPVGGDVGLISLQGTAGGKPATDPRRIRFNVRANYPCAGARPLVEQASTTPLERQLNGLWKADLEKRFRSPARANSSSITLDLLSRGNPGSIRFKRLAHPCANPAACRPRSRGWGYKSGAAPTIC